MFQRGPRIDSLEAPASNVCNRVPGVHKRGACSEDIRSAKVKETNVPKPAPAEPDTKNTFNKTEQSISERYNILQRKLEDLEKVHLEGKKTHQADVDRLKSELSLRQKTITEQTERIEKYKKRNDALDFRIQELNKTALVDHTEIKDLKLKLKMLEHEKLQSVKKQGEEAELKKTIQSIESKHRDDTRERNKRIAELEKMLSSERKKREALEHKLQEIGEKGERDVLTARGATKKTENELVNTRKQLQGAVEQLAKVERSFADEREGFLARLTNCNLSLSRTAEEFGRLAASSVPLTTYRSLKRVYNAAEMKILRLERKLANAEGQVTELVHLIRQQKDQNDLLTEQLEDVIRQLTFYESMQCDVLPAHDDDIIADLRHQLEHLQQDYRSTFWNTNNIEQLYELLSDYHHISAHQLLFAYTCVDKTLIESTNLADRQSQSLQSALASHKVTAAQLETVQKERCQLEEELRALEASHASTRETCASLENQVKSFEEQTRRISLAHGAALKKEKDAIERLAGTLQKSRQAEDGLRSEIDKLLGELADAERYREAYTLLSQEVNALIARQQLAEEEAEHLSKFNAEILGHHNPAQRIAYVDRIRRELTEAKQKIVILTREQEMMVSLTADLQDELDTYKSVAVPISDKPRTQITRVNRLPLSNVTRSLNASVNATQNVQMKAKAMVIPDLDPISGDMTLDELV